MPVVFEYSSTRVEIQNPSRSNIHKIKKFQALGRTAGGQIYAYDKGPTSKRLELEFLELRQSEKDALESFYDTTVDGVITNFEYTDHFGTTWNAKFLETELNFEETDSEGESKYHFTSGGNTYPSYRYTKGIYRVTMILEIWS